MDENGGGHHGDHPNTLGLFEENLSEIAEIVHRKGRGLSTATGPNLNALMGIVKLGHLGVDVVHINLHKTFSTPHGGGGPGAGPVAIKRNSLPISRPVIGQERRDVPGSLRETAEHRKV